MAFRMPPPIFDAGALRRHPSEPSQRRMKMVDRRAFLKTACVAVGAIAAAGMTSCANASESDKPALEDKAEKAPEASNVAVNEAEQPQSAPSADEGTVAVVYFSVTGNTRSVAEKIAAAADASLEEIVPAQPYSAADIDYNTDCRANDEQNDASARPAIAASVPSVSDADVVFLGYPIWWGAAPRIIETYLGDVDLAGKTVVPFCTSGSSPISGSLSALKQAVPNATWEEGGRFSSGASQQEIDEWVSGILG